MAAPDEAEQALRGVARLAEERGAALDRAFRLFGDGALLGAGAQRLHEGMVERHLAVRRAFARAFDEIERLATARGDPPKVPAPHIRQPPAVLKPPPGGYVGGDPALLQAMDAELGRAGDDWRDAGQAVADALARLGLGTSPGQDIARAGAWLTDQRADLRRRRAELLKTPPVELTPSGPPAAPDQSTAPPAEQSTAEQLTTQAGEALSWWGDLWADSVGAVGDAVGLPEVRKGAREYVDKVALPFTQGAVEATAGMAEFGWKNTIPGIVTDLDGFAQKMSSAAETGEYAAQHPVEFVKSVTDWETLTEDPARWFGRLVPDVVLSIAGGGAPLAERSATLAERAGRVTRGGRAAANASRPFEIPPPRTAADGPPLDTISMRPNHVGESQRGVWYLNAQELEQRRLVVHDGKLYDTKGKLFDTSQGRAHWAPGEPRAIFVMDKFGNLYAELDHVVGVFHHSSFLRGGDVAGAGDMEVRNGVLRVISRSSGHYRPLPADLDRVIGMLKRAGVSFGDVRKEGF